MAVPKMVEVGVQPMAGNRSRFSSIDQLANNSATFGDGKEAALQSRRTIGPATRQGYGVIINRSLAYISQSNNCEWTARTQEDRKSLKKIGPFGNSSENKEQDPPR